MDIDQAERLGLEKTEAYQAELVHPDREIVRAAANGQYRKAGLAFAKLLPLQEDNRLLPTPEGYEVIFGQLNAIPSKVLGIA